jgi:hypothetical protein
MIISFGWWNGLVFTETEVATAATTTATIATSCDATEQK